MSTSLNSTVRRHTLFAVARTALMYSVTLITWFIGNEGQSVTFWLILVVVTLPTSQGEMVAATSGALTALAHRVDIGKWYLPINPFLVLPRRARGQRTLEVSGRPTRTWSSTDEVALELSLRAERAEAMAAGAAPYLLTGREFRRRWGQLGREGRS